MTDKVTLKDLATFDNSIINSVNNNNDTITAAVNNTLSLDGTSPNQMNADIDMNGNSILNLAPPVSGSSAVRLVDVINNPTLVLTIPPVGTSGPNVPLLNANNTFSGDTTFSGTSTFAGTNTFSGTNNFTGTILSDFSTLSGALSGSTTLQASSVASGTLTLPALTDTLVSRTSTDTLTNKTLTSPVLSTIHNVGTLTLPTSTDTLVGRNTTDTLTNKILTSPSLSTIVNGGVLTLPTGTDTLVGRNTTDTLANKTLTAPVLGTATGTSLSVTGSLTAFSGTAIPAGGTAGKGVLLSSVANLGLFFGSGVPTLSAAQGSLYIRTDGSSTSTRMYINTDGSTTWTNVTTAA